MRETSKYKEAVAVGLYCMSGAQARRNATLHSFALAVPVDLELADSHSTVLRRLPAQLYLTVALCIIAADGVRTPHTFIATTTL